MKKTIKLIPAIIMLLISLVLVSTSTYAWFSMNSTVTATGMEIRATSDSTLLISDSASGVFSDVSSVTSTSIAMKPTTSFDGNTFAIIDTTKAKVPNGSSYNATMLDGSTFNATGLITESTNTASTYWKDTSFFLKYTSNGSTTISVYVSNINVEQHNDDTNVDIYKSIRVGIVYKSTTYVYNANGGVASLVGKYENSAWSLVSPSYTTYPTSIGTVGSTPEEVVIRIWFEGQDTSCYTDNVTTKNITVSVQFTTEQPT